MDTRSRLARLDRMAAKLADRGPVQPAVVEVELPLDQWTVETMQAAVERVGYPALIVPKSPDPATWERLAAAQQQRLALAEDRRRREAPSPPRLTR